MASSSTSPENIPEASPRVIVHVDMDAFYTSIEQMDHPEYRGKPVVVGADPMGGRGRGVVSAASYEARRFGVHSALPISIAFRRCSHAVFLRPRFGRYEELSRKVMGILAGFSPLVEQISIDEAFLDCTGTEGLFGSPEELGRRIKERIRAETGLTASVGVAANKSIAKIASDLKKPDGLCICPAGRERDFMGVLPLARLWGVGRKTLQRLEALGFRGVRDIQDCTVEKLKSLFGKQGVTLWELARGVDSRPVLRSAPRKSISQETTFREDTGLDAQVEHVLFQLADSLTRIMRSEGIRGRTVVLKIRLAPFDTFTRSRTLRSATCDVQRVRDTAVQLYRNFNREGRKVRLVGVGVTNLEHEVSRRPEQLDLFARRTPQEHPLDETGRLLDQMKRLYGDKVTRAAFLPRQP
jgi:nucleotidyltransferase/DNA polymerase involved in DNA repair